MKCTEVNNETMHY